MAYIDVKHTIWGRYNIPDSINLEEFKEELNNCLNSEQDSLIQEKCPNFEYLIDTSDYMVPSENQAPTIELYNDNNECIWENFENM